MKTLEDLFFGRNIPFDSPALAPDEYRRLTAEIWKNVTPLYGDSVSVCGSFWNP